MARVELDVPFFEKTVVQRMGARWDTRARVWYLPEGVNPSPFARWCWVQPEIGIRARRYLIAQTCTACWRCERATRVFAFVLPAMHKTLDRDARGQLTWQRHKLPCFVHYVTDLPQSVAARMHALTPHFRLDASRTAGAHWMNHCAACGLKLGDHGLHREAGGAFAPLDAAAAAHIGLQEIAEPFSCNGSLAYGEYYFTAMRRA